MEARRRVDARASPPPLFATSPRKTHPQNGANFWDRTLEPALNPSHSSQLALCKETAAGKKPSAHAKWAAFQQGSWNENNDGEAVRDLEPVHGNGLPGACLCARRDSYDPTG